MAMASALAVKEKKGRGRALICSRNVAAGEVVLSEDPALLVVSNDQHEYVCCWCMRLLSGPFSCSGCQQASFCSPSCQQAAAATPWVHSAAVCGAYKACANFDLSEDDHNMLRFLVHCYGMKHAQAAGNGGSYLQILTTLQGQPTAEVAAAAQQLHRLLCIAYGDASGGGMSVEEVAHLVAKEQLNSYGILAPVEGEGERQLRGCGIYLEASLINHECIPNVTRFDHFDSLKEGNTRIEFRAMHALPAGTEVVQSYFPLNWDYSERQQQCRDVYGFTCRCPRCQTEAAWERGEASASPARSNGGTDDTEMGEGGYGASGASSSTAPPQGDRTPLTSAGTTVEGGGGEDGPLDETYLHLFLLKYVCPRDACFGTMAPVLGTDVLQCSVCGGTRTEAQFLAELEASH